LAIRGVCSPGEEAATGAYAAELKSWRIQPAISGCGTIVAMQWLIFG